MIRTFGFIKNDIPLRAVLITTVKLLVVMIELFVGDTISMVSPMTQKMEQKRTNKNVIDFIVSGLYCGKRRRRTLYHRLLIKF